MIGFAELIFIVVLLAILYFLLKPPVWYNKSRKRTFISQYGGIVEQQKVQDLVASVGLNVARAANYPEESLEFQLLRSSIPNAFAWDTKTVFLTQGLFTLIDSRDELAAVLAHEIGHLTAGHPKVRVTNRAKSILLSSVFSGMGWGMTRVVSFVSNAEAAAYSRDQEHEADRLGVSYLRRAGYDPGAAIQMLEKLHRIGISSGRSMNSLQELLSTHPIDKDRIDRIRELANRTDD